MKAQERWKSPVFITYQIHLQGSPGMIFDCHIDIPFMIIFIFVFKYFSSLPHFQRKSSIL